MPRASFPISFMRQHERRDGSIYYIGGWHDLTLHLSEQPDGLWRLVASENKPAAMRNLAAKHEARSNRLAPREAELTMSGEWGEASKVRGAKRVHSKLAAALRKETDAQTE